MNDRLVVMRDVARWKWVNKAPIEDPEREASSLRDVAEKGRDFGLDPEATRAFFEAQIEAAKLMQREYFRRWREGAPLPEGDIPDLKTEIRGRIDALNRDLTEALPDALARLSAWDDPARSLDSPAKRLLTAEGIDGETRETALKPLLTLAGRKRAAAVR